MFCHDSSSLLVVFEKKQHDRINTREETMGETRGRREQVIACTMIEEAHAAAGEKMASICQWGGLSGNISDAFAGVPCLTPLCSTLLPIGFPPSCCLRSHYPPSRLRPRQKGRRAGIMRLSHSRRRTAERSCLMRDTREMKASMGTSASLFEQETGWS